MTREWEDELAAVRHRRLCTAIPFPRLDWSEPKTTEANLEEMYAYAETLAHSAIDWYNRKCIWKKIWSVILRFLVFAFAVMGVLVPFLKIASANLEAKILKGFFGHIIDNPSAAEVALILFGVAVGFHLIDHYAGFTTAWMRYKTAAIQISEELMKFQFDWNRLERLSARGDAPPSKEIPGAANDPVNFEAAETASSEAKTNADISSKDPVSARIELVHAFCFTVFKIVRGETSVWANELKSGIALLAQHLHSAGFGRMGGKQ